MCLSHSLTQNVARMAARRKRIYQSGSSTWGWSEVSQHSRDASDNSVSPNPREPALNVFDRSEFPSLSGAPQSQQHNASQAIWNNPNLRTQPSAPGQRPQTQGPTSSAASQAIQPPSQSQPQQRSDSQHETPSNPYPLGGGLGDFRFDDGGGGLSGVSRRPAQQSSGDDFPPLGQGGQFAGLGDPSNYANSAAAGRGGVIGQGDVQRDGSGPPYDGRITSPTDGSNRGARGHLCVLDEPVLTQDTETKQCQDHL